MSGPDGTILELILPILPRSNYNTNKEFVYSSPVISIVPICFIVPSALTTGC